MRSALIRLLIAVVVCVVLLAILPAIFEVFGFRASENVLLIFRGAIALFAFLYVIAGPNPPAWS